MNTKLLEKQNEKFYTARYDRAFKEIFLKEKKSNIIKKAIRTILKNKNPIDCSRNHRKKSRKCLCKKEKLRCINQNRTRTYWYRNEFKNEK